VSTGYAVKDGLKNDISIEWFSVFLQDGECEIWINGICVANLAGGWLDRIKCVRLPHVGGTSYAFALING